MNFDDRIKLQVFQGDSTYQNDYTLYASEKRSLIKWEQDRDEKPEKSPRELILQDHHTYQPWRKGSHVPFNLLWQPKPITGTNPHEPRKNISETPTDSSTKLNAMRTRPRCYMSPAVSIDDVPDPAIRDLLIAHMYTSDWRKAEREAAATRFTHRDIAASTVEGAGQDRLRYRPDLYPPLANGWRDKAKEWDLEQCRGTVDSTAQFWKNRPETMEDIMASEKLVTEEVRAEIRQLLTTDKLRLPHDKPKQGYAGYDVRLSRGVALRKKDRTVVDPDMSVSQAITNRYAEDHEKQ